MPSLPMPSANELLRRWHSEDAAGHDSMGNPNPDADLRLSLWDETMGISLETVNWGRRKRAALALRQVRLDDIEEIIGRIETHYDGLEGDDDPASLVIALRRLPQRPDGYFKGSPMRAVVVRALLSLGVAMEHCEEGFRSVTRWCTRDPVCTLVSPIRALGKVGGSTARCVSPVARITWGVASAAARAVRLATRKSRALARLAVMPPRSPRGSPDAAARARNAARSARDASLAMASALEAVETLNAAPAAAAQEEDEEDAWASDKENETDAVVTSAVKAKLTSPRRLDRLFGSDASNRVYSPQNWNGKRRKLSGLAAAAGVGSPRGSVIQGIRA